MRTLVWSSPRHAVDWPSISAMPTCLEGAISAGLELHTPRASHRWLFDIKFLIDFYAHVWWWLLAWPSLALFKPLFHKLHFSEYFLYKVLALIDDHIFFIFMRFCLSYILGPFQNIFGKFPSFFRPFIDLLDIFPYKFVILGVWRPLISQDVLQVLILLFIEMNGPEHLQYLFPAFIGQLASNHQFQGVFQGDLRVQFLYLFKFHTILLL
jgi:hypothetical protein